MLLVLVLFVGIIIGTSVTNTPTDPSPDSALEERETEEGLEDVTPEIQDAEPEPEAIVLSGIGPQATESFRPQDGLAVARMDHQGESNFIVYLLGESGEEIGPSMVNEIGVFEGSSAFASTSGTYLLNVDADGPWTITLEQPRPQDAPATREFSGTGATATAQFTLPRGLARFQMTHEGESNFIVYLLNSEGNEVDVSLVNEIGPFNGSQAVRVPEAGTYLLDVDADGPWTIRVE